MVDKYVLSEEQVELDKRDNLIKKKKEIENEINIQDQILDENKRMKLLFSGDGILLEIICKEVFENIGFEVNTPDGNRDDLIIKLNERVAVIEIKGVTKSSAEKHAAQLQKWVSNYHVENGINPKGILIVNTYKNNALDKRIGKDFPDQMKKYVNQMEHCLITGIQLLAMYIDHRKGIIDKEKFCKILFETTGEVKYTDKIDNYIKLIPPSSTCSEGHVEAR